MTTSLEASRCQVRPAGASTALHESLARARHREAKRRRGREQDDGEAGQERREANDARREPEIHEERHSGGDVGGNEARQEPDRPVGRHQRQAASGCDEHAAFGYELREQARHRCTKRGSHREFTFAPFRSNEQQAGDVHRGEKQQQARARNQQKQDGPDRAHDHFLERHDR